MGKMFSIVVVFFFLAKVHAQLGYIDVTSDEVVSSQWYEPPRDNCECIALTLFDHRNVKNIGYCLDADPEIGKWCFVGADSTCPDKKPFTNGLHYSADACTIKAENLKPYILGSGVHQSEVGHSVNAVDSGVGDGTTPQLGAFGPICIACFADLCPACIASLGPLAIACCAACVPVCIT